MNKNILLFLAFFSAIQANESLKKNYKQAIVAPEPEVGRLGNSLWNYCHAQWVAHKAGLPCYFREFEYYRAFAFSKKENTLKNAKRRRIVHVNGKNHQALSKKHQTKNVTLMVPFGFREPQWKSRNEIVKAYKTNKPFAQKLKNKIKPVREIVEIEKPSNMVSVALHVRKGGGYGADKEGIHKIYPTKFPPDSFYMEQLIKLSFMLNHPPMYVYIFTDDKNPENIAQSFMDTINLSNITYDYRKTENAHNLNVIDDLFNIAKFEYLIRPNSSYTRIAEIIGDHKICILPTKAHMDNEKRLFFITDVEVNIYDKSLKKFDKSLRKPLSKSCKRLALNLDN